MATALYWLVIAIVLAEFVWSTVLTLLNIKASHGPVPDVLQGLYDEARYRKQQDYAMTNRTYRYFEGKPGSRRARAYFPI